MKASLRIRMIPMRPRKGDVDGNLAQLRQHLAEAQGETDLLVFAETVISGYFVEGGVEEVAQSAHALAKGLGPSGPGFPDIIFGAYEAGEDGVLYNSAFHFTPNPPPSAPSKNRSQDGPEGALHEGDAVQWALLHRHRKMFLPTYGLFDEARFVKPGLEISGYESRFGRMGLLICEEMLHSLPPTILALGGAELIVALSASPIRELVPQSALGASAEHLPGSLQRWDVAARAVTLEHGIHLALGHIVGSEGGKLFGGGSGVYGPGGRVLGRAPLFSTDPLDVPVSFAAGRQARVRSPMLEDLRVFLPHVVRALKAEVRRGAEATTRSESPNEIGRLTSGQTEVASNLASNSRRWSPVRTGMEPDPADRSPLALDLELVSEALVTFLRDEVQGGRGFERVVVGVSGGVDSAVTLALAVRAFGASAVHGVLLPYATSSAESLVHGREVAGTFGVSVREISIAKAVDTYIDAEEPGLSGLRRGNLAARFRAMVLWDQAANLDALILGTGNKSERLLGYFTWHADDAPPINPIGDLLKSQVWDLARHLGVPEAVITKPASADLVVGVHDEDELGVRYADADLVLHWLLAGQTPESLCALGFDVETVRRVHARLSGTHWKRRPPTSALLTGTGIGEFYLRPVDF